MLFSKRFLAVSAKEQQVVDYEESAAYWYFQTGGGRVTVVCTKRLL